MDVMILTFVVLGVVILAMSIGVLLGGKPIKGSCGGMSAIGMDTVCDICGGNPNKCEEETKKSASREPAELAYEVKSGA
ncbi:(Na+)-NQR maturation NqrM [Marinobacterium aestuariivivens]|uniref:(Na+)-NQR maturation NqrM n=1 Tax=Marinobacterium aestuariivivens TaxID=1698799 RepID=A0ABW2A4T3_9GAMM